MKQLLLSALVLSFCTLAAQEPQIQITKKGKIRKRIKESTPLILVTSDGSKYVGPAYIMNDSFIFISKVSVAVRDITHLEIIRRRNKRPFDWEKFGYTTLGMALSTAGMSLSNREPLPRAIAYSAVIGYSPYLFNMITRINLKKKRFHFGRKKQLRIWSLTRYDQPARPLAPF